MDKKTTNRELYKSHENYVGKKVCLSGWVRNLRDQKQFAFIDFNDGSFFKNVQIVIEKNRTSDYENAVRIRNGSAVTVKGTVEKTPGAKQLFEVKADTVDLEGDCPPEYPLQPKRHTPEFLRTISHIRARTNLFSAVFRVRSVAAFAVHKFFNDKNFVYVHTPIITANDCEGAGEMFRVTTLDDKNPPLNQDGTVNYREDFFGKKANLTVSGQLNAEAYALAYSKVYTFGPTFRAENSNTTRHASEFWMIEPEIAFAQLDDNMKLAEEMLKYIINYVMENCPDEMEFFNKFVDKGLAERLKNVVENDFGVITYTKAIEELTKAGNIFEYEVSWGCDLQTEHERYITEKLFKKPVFVIDYPSEIKAFYMKQNNDKKTVRAMDCLVPGVGEIIGGSQREENHEVLIRRIKEFGLDPDDYKWYLDLRRYGGCKHSGYGLGFERMIMYLTGVSNIRDVIPFPRTVNNAEY